MGFYPNKEGLLNETAQQAAERLADLVHPLGEAQWPMAPQERSQFFVSGLSACGFALAEGDDITSLGMVTGFSVYHVGWQWTPIYESRELTAVTKAEQQVRHLALSRLQQEAAHLGAHGVMDVCLQQRNLPGEVLEFSATGTAIRLTQGKPPPRPFLTTLSAAEFWTLRRAGYRPCGIALGVCVFYHHSSIAFRGLWLSRRRGQLGRRQMNGIEYAEYTEAIQSVRRMAIDRLESQAGQGLADGIIALRLDHSIAPPPTDDSGSYRRLDLIVRFIALGTSITAHRDRWPIIEYALPLNN